MINPFQFAICLTCKTMSHFVIGDRSEAQHHVVEESGLERKSKPDCQPDSSTPLRFARNDRVVSTRS